MATVRLALAVPRAGVSMQRNFLARFVIGMRSTSPGLISHYSSSPTNGSQPNAPLKKPHTPVGKHDDPDKHRDAEQEPLAPFPDDVNPATGEKGGPRGPEPTRYGDWERKGRCIDF